MAKTNLLAAGFWLLAAGRTAAKAISTWQLAIGQNKLFSCWLLAAGF
jgi:hypothetical protein